MDPLRVCAPLETEIVAIPGDGNVVPVPFRDGMVLGRAPDADISLPDPGLARYHVRFELEDGYLVARDLGTSVQLRRAHARVPSVEVRLGDVIYAGDVPIIFQHRLAAPPWYEEAKPLLDRIREDLTDDNARLVFADWLASRDPIRSEFIACQIAAEQGSAAAASRAEQLMCVGLAAPLAVPIASWRFRRGFVSIACGLFPGVLGWLADDHPECTFEHLPYTAPPMPR